MKPLLAVLLLSILVFAGCTQPPVTAPNDDSTVEPPPLPDTPPVDDTLPPAPPDITPVQPPVVPDELQVPPIGARANQPSRITVSRALLLTHEYPSRVTQYDQDIRVELTGTLQRVAGYGDDPVFEFTDATIQSDLDETVTETDETCRQTTTWRLMDTQPLAEIDAPDGFTFEFSPASSINPARLELFGYAYLQTQENYIAETIDPYVSPNVRTDCSAASEDIGEAVFDLPLVLIIDSFEQSHYTGTALVRDNSAPQENADAYVNYAIPVVGLVDFLSRPFSDTQDEIAAAAQWTVSWDIYLPPLSE